MDGASSDVWSIYKAYRTVLQMLEDRGYVSPDEYQFDKDVLNPKETDQGYQNFIDWVIPENERSEDDSKSNATVARKNLNEIVFEKKNDCGAIALFWTYSLGIDVVQNIFTKMKELEVTKAILVHVSKISSHAGTAIRSLKSQKYFIETFSESELQFNISRHVDVPRHIICSATKKKEVFEKYAIKENGLPLIKVTDPMVRYIGANKGQLIKIVRPSDSTPNVNLNGEKKELYDIVYRLVV